MIFFYIYSIYLIIYIYTYTCMYTIKFRFDTPMFDYQTQRVFFFLLAKSPAMGRCISVLWVHQTSCCSRTFGSKFGIAVFDRLTHRLFDQKYFEPTILHLLCFWVYMRCSAVWTLGFFCFFHTTENCSICLVGL